MKNGITPEEIRQLFTYNPENGSLVWRERPRDRFANTGAYRTWNKRYAGKEAGCLASHGYYYVTVHGRSINKHRIVWAYVYGKWTEQYIDHINGDKSNNSISNLREVYPFQNSQNAKRASNNSSGVTGVCYKIRRNKWEAYISVDRKIKFLGLFSDKNSAIAARKAAEIFHGYHPNHGRV